MGDVWFQVDRSGNKVFDLAAVMEANQSSVSAGKVQLGEGAEGLTVTLDDVLQHGQADVLGGHEMMIDGSGTQTVDLSAGAHWSSAGPVDAGSSSYAVYVDPVNQAKLLVNDRLAVVL